MVWNPSLMLYCLREFINLSMKNGKIVIIPKSGYGNNVNRSVFGQVRVVKCKLEIIMLMDMMIRIELFINFMDV